MAVYEFEMDSSTKLMDSSTLVEYVYQPLDDEVYNKVWEQRNFIYKDRADNKIIAGYYNGDTGDSDAYQFMAEAFVIPDNIASLIGFVTDSVTATNEVTVYSVGAVVGGFSGLTIDEKYFVQDDGSVGLTGTHEIGRAISTDKIYIYDMR